MVGSVEDLAVPTRDYSLRSRTAHTESRYNVFSLIAARQRHLSGPIRKIIRKANLSDSE